MFDYDPVPGYEDLVSEADGLIPQLNNQLAPGTYELRETQAPLGYLPLPHNVRFVVGAESRSSITTLMFLLSLTEKARESWPLR